MYTKLAAARHVPVDIGVEQKGELLAIERLGRRSVEMRLVARTGRVVAELGDERHREWPSPARRDESR